MRIEDVVWGLLKEEIKINELDEYTLYYTYSTLIELRNLIIKVLEKYGDELGDYLFPVLNTVNKLIDKIYPKIKDLDICYTVLEVSIKVSNTVSRKIFEKIMIGICNKAREGDMRIYCLGLEELK